MAIFSRNKKAPAASEDDGAPKGAWKRPSNSGFKQQRLKAWQPILTPKTVLPTLFIIGLIFAPIGGLIIWGSNNVSVITLDYTNCDTKATSDFAPLPTFSYDLRSSDSHLTPTPPQWKFTNDSSNADKSLRNHCQIQFDVPADLGEPVFLYYKLTSFYQNHRRYVKSLDAGQLKGDAVSPSSLNGGDCKPLAERDGKAIYPCGLIANSVFNDTIGKPILLSPSGNSEASNVTYNFTDKGIAWPGEAKKYTNKPSYDYTKIVPPPNWKDRYPNDYDATNIPQLQDDEHFQNWMRTAGLPTFTKLYYKNTNETMTKGTYQIDVYMNFPVTNFGGTKSLVISTVSWVGGKNPFLGWAYIGAAALFVLLALAGTARHLISPRKLGDMSLLSWNQPQPVPGRH